MRTDSIDEKILKRIPKEIVFTAFFFALGAAILFGILAAFFVMLGGIVAAFGFIGTKQSVTKFLTLKKKETFRAAILIYLLRLLLIIIIFFIIILFFSKLILAFIAGFSATILVFLVEAVAALTKLKQWKN